MKLAVHYRTVLPVLIVTVLISGCFKKNVMKDNADDVEEAIIMESGGAFYLVTNEEIFQATSKSDKQGIRTTTGYTEYRLSSYDLNTGKLVSRVDLGERDDNYHYFLGPTDGKLWYISMDKETGLHARDPKTLNIIVTNNDILKINPNFANNTPEVKWHELRKYFGYDSEKNVPLVADNSGYIFTLDPVTLKAEKTDKSMENYKYDESNTSTSLNLDVDKHVNLSGEPRKKIRYFSKELNEPTFLDGQFLLSSVNVNPLESNPEFFAPLTEKINSSGRKIDSLRRLIEGLSPEEISKDYSLRYAERNIKRATDEIERTQKEIRSKTEHRNNGIITKERGVFILHKSNASDTSKSVINKIIFNSDTTVSQVWETYIPTLFSEPSKVLSKPGFEYVFSKGSPKVSTMRVIYGNDKLVIIHMLRAVCLDGSTGKILWDIEL